MTFFKKKNGLINLQAASLLILGLRCERLPVQQVHYVLTLTWELISVTRSDSSVTATGVGSSLEARVACCN